MEALLLISAWTVLSWLFLASFNLHFLQSCIVSAVNHRHPEVFFELLSIQIIDEFSYLILLGLDDIAYAGNISIMRNLLSFTKVTDDAFR